MAATDVDNLEKTFGIHKNVTYVQYKIKSKLIRLLFYSPWLILKNRIDFAHFQYRVPPLKFCRYIDTIHDVLFEDYPEYFPKLGRISSYYTYKYSAKLSDIILTVSPYAKDTIKKHLGVKEVTITPNGIADAFFAKYDKGEAQRLAAEKFNVSNYIIYISRWEPRKKHLLIVKAFTNLQLYKNYTIVFIGNTTFKDPDYDAFYNALDADVKSKISNFKNIDFNDAITLLRGASLSVYPSVAEGFGIPPLEAIAASIPTLSSNATAMADYADFMGPYMFDPYNEEEFTSKLKTILLQDNTEALIPMKEAIQQRYTWKIAAQAYNTALNKYLNKQ